jgi:hypothetical protein
LTGIFFLNAGGSVKNVHVENMYIGPPSLQGCQGGLGIRANATNGTPQTVTITNTVVTNYLKGGLVASGMMTMNVTGSTVGPPFAVAPNVIAQNGVQYGGALVNAGAGGTMSSSTVFGSGFGNATDAATAFLLFGAKNVTLTNNIITGARTDIGVDVSPDTFQTPNVPSTGIVVSYNQIGRTSADSPDTFGLGVSVDASSALVSPDVVTTNGAGSLRASAGTDPASTATLICNAFSGWKTNIVGAVQATPCTTPQIPSFKLLPGGATDISVGANGAVWAIGTNPTGPGFGIWRWTGSAWTPVPGAAVRIGVDPNGNPWVTNTRNQIYQWTGTAFVHRPGGGTDISVGADGAVWIIGTNPTGVGFGIWRWTGSAWTSVPGSAVRVGVDPNGNPWVTNTRNQPYQWTGTAFVHRPGGATDISVGANGAVWIIGTNPTGPGFGIWFWTGSAWTPVQGAAVGIGVGPTGIQWVVNSRNQIYAG